MAVGNNTDLTQPSSYLQPLPSRLSCLLLLTTCGTLEEPRQCHHTNFWTSTTQHAAHWRALTFLVFIFCHGLPAGSTQHRCTVTIRPRRRHFAYLGTTAHAKYGQFGLLER